MTITRIICLMGIAAFSLLAAGTPAAYADNFGSNPTGDYYMWGPLWALDGPAPNTPKPPMNEIIGTWLSEEWYYSGFGNNSNSTPSIEDLAPPPENDLPETIPASFTPEPGTFEVPLDTTPPGTGNETYENPTPYVEYFTPPSENTPPVVTPEPGSLLLLGTGLAAFGLIRHRLRGRKEI